MSSSLDRTPTNDTYCVEGSTASQGPESAVLPYLVAPANERCPVHKLPTELTGNILTSVVWEHAEITHQYMEVNEEQEYDIRTRLSLVCKRWKEITQGVRFSCFRSSNSPLLPLSSVKSPHQTCVYTRAQCRAELYFYSVQTALIWSNVYINEQTPLLRVANYMERSKQCGLSIKSMAEDHERTSFFNDVWPFIAPHVFRLVEFDFELRCITSVYPCPQHHGDNRRHALYSLARAGQATRLKKLRLRFCAEGETYMQNREESVVSLFGGQTPALTYLEVRGINVDWEGMKCLKALEVLKLERLLEVSSLTMRALHFAPILLLLDTRCMISHIHIPEQHIRPSYNVFTRVLSSLPNLKTLHLCSSGPSGSPTDWPSDRVITVISTLENLVLTQRTCAYVCALLTRFTFPNLKRLAVELPECPYADNFHNFVDYLCSHKLTIPKSNGEPAEKPLEPMASRLEHLRLDSLQC